MRPVEIIAEIGVNHNGSLELAEEMLVAAAKTGATTVKFQTFVPEELVSHRAPKAEYQKRTTGKSGGQLEMLRKLQLSKDAHFKLLKICKREKVEFMSTPFDVQSLHFLCKDLGLKRIKISSGDITNGPFLVQIGQMAEQVILSTGMSALGDIEGALGALAMGMLEPKKDWRRFSADDLDRAYFSAEGQALLRQRLTLLHCTSEYPAPPGDVNLKAMRTLRRAFRVPVGLSDHTEGTAIPTAAVALGARVIEKHFTTDRTLPGPDQTASLDVEGFARMVRDIRLVEAALGDSRKLPRASEIHNRKVARKSIVANRSLKQGDRLSWDAMSFKRPGNGVSPMKAWSVVDSGAPRDLEPDEVL
jgi:N-acetylneuraminate synthase